MSQRSQEEMLAEVRFRCERLDLHRARVYSGRPTNPNRLRELQRAYDGAASRLRRSEAGAKDIGKP